jgi:hypothetical protein
MGGFPVSSSNLFNLLSSKSHILLYPGGLREGFHRKVSPISRLFIMCFIFLTESIFAHLNPSKVFDLFFDSWNYIQSAS